MAASLVAAAFFTLNPEPPIDPALHGVTGRLFVTLQPVFEKGRYTHPREEMAILSSETFSLVFHFLHHQPHRDYDVTLRLRDGTGDVAREWSHTIRPTTDNWVRYQEVHFRTGKDTTGTWTADAWLNGHKLAETEFHMGY